MYYTNTLIKRIIILFKRKVYVVIFSAEKHFYRLISAFPVFYNNQKSDFDKDAERYHWSYFDE